MPYMKLANPISPRYLSRKKDMCTVLSGRRGKDYLVKKKMHSTKKSSTYLKVFLISTAKSTSF